ncbi:MAG: MAPEG family protein [Rickettsiales bacterium]|nr:MAPEG family protein [Rickettsiales bacterium]
MTTLLIAAILTALFLYLSLGIIKVRRINKIPIGDGGDIILQLWIRAQGNFAEYSPFILLLLFILESSGVSSVEIAIFGSLFLASRAMHAYSLIKHEKYIDGILQNKPIYRMAGMMLTFLVMFYCIGRLVITYFL